MQLILAAIVAVALALQGVLAWAVLAGVDPLLLLKVVRVRGVPGEDAMVALAAVVLRIACRCCGGEGEAKRMADTENEGEGDVQGGRQRGKGAETERERERTRERERERERERPAP